MAQDSHVGIHGVDGSLAKRVKAGEETVLKSMAFQAQERTKGKLYTIYKAAKYHVIDSFIFYSFRSCSRTFMMALPRRFSPQLERFCSASLATNPTPQIRSYGDALATC